MRRRIAGPALVALALALLLGAAAARRKGSLPERPNVVVVVLDDFRYDDQQYLPELAEIAAAGTTFRRAYAAHALCTPSRATLLTGNLPSTHGVRSNRANLIPAESTIATWFDAEGYTTGLIGKYANRVKLLQNIPPPGWDVWHPTEKHGDLGREQSMLLARDMADFIGTAPEPFLLWGAFVAPHGPLSPPQRCRAQPVPPLPTPPGFDERVRERAERHWSLRLRRICGLRDAVRLVFDAIAARGVAERTIVVVASDQGYMLGEHGLLGKNVHYEPVTHAVLMMAGPGIEARVVTGKLASLADVAPTLADLAGVRRPAVDGRNLITGESRRHVPIEAAGVTALRRMHSKLVKSTDGSPPLVFDLVADPFEIAPKVHQ